MTHTTVAVGQRDLACASDENWFAPTGFPGSGADPAAGVGGGTGLDAGAEAVGAGAGAAGAAEGAGAGGAAGCCSLSGSRAAAALSNVRLFRNAVSLLAALLALHSSRQAPAVF